MGLLTFKKGEVDYLSRFLVKQIDEKSGDTNSQNKLKDLLDKLNKLTEIEGLLDVDINEKDIEEVNQIIFELEQINDYYVSQSDMGALEIYDDIKKQIAGKLEYLSTYKDKFLTESNRVEDILKKEIRTKLALGIKRDDNVSFTQAFTLVEADKRYTELRDKVYFVKSIADRVKTKYNFFSQLWQIVFQSVSTASKEKYASSQNN